MEKNVLKTRTIVIEDHDLFRNYLKKFIEQVGNCQIVAEAADGVEALNTIKNVAADLIVLDLSLPRLNGLTVLKEAKKITDTKILVVTMHSETDMVKQALDAGADGYFLKEMGIRVLEEAILGTLEGKRPVCTVD
jgi:DNA-binding NarL/FixJ family response regulator